jgi:hypothetical protein
MVVNMIVIVVIMVVVLMMADCCKIIEERGWMVRVRYAFVVVYDVVSGYEELLILFSVKIFILESRVWRHFLARIGIDGKERIRACLRYSVQ